MNTSPQASFKTICKRIEKEMKRLHVSGVALGSHHKGRAWTAGFGVTHREHPLPVTPDTLMQVGSISKTFTGTVLMMLAEQGQVDLDAPVRRYLKDSNVAKQVTLRYLLTHTGGWVGDYFNDFGNGDDALAILTNGDEGGILTAQTFGWALELYFGIKLKTPRPLAKPQELPEFVGRYRIGTECFDLKLKGKPRLSSH